MDRNSRRIKMPELATYLQDFTERHHARPVTLEVVVGATWNIQESGMPLVGVDLDTKGPDAPALEIFLGDEPSHEMRHLTHTLPRVKRVTVELGENQEEQRLVIDGEDGSQAVLSID